MAAMSVSNRALSVSLELDSRPESVTCVRAMLTGAGESIGLAGEQLDDLRTAVSEACNNVVLHAYSGRTGPLLVDVDLGPGGVQVRVADRGTGISSLTSAQDRMRVGIALITALTERAEFASLPGGGTEVRMAFGRNGNELAPGVPPEAGPSRSVLGGDVVVRLSSVSLLPAVLARICAAVAARAQFTLDRHSDLELVSDAISAHARQVAPNAGIEFAIVVLARWIELTVGPLPARHRAPTPRIPAVVGATAPVLPRRRRIELDPLRLVTRLADALTIETAGASETLHVLMFDRRTPAAGSPQGR